MTWPTPKTDFAVGDVLTAAEMNDVGDGLAYLGTAGSDLASASTISPTVGFHGVTGTTTINDISMSGAVEGLPVRLWFKAALTVANNGGGTGNIRTKSGSDLSVTANQIVTFAYDGTYWREEGSAASPNVYAQATWPPGAGETVAVLADAAYGNLWPYMLILDKSSGDASYPWEPIGAGTPSSLVGESPAYGASNVATVAINVPIACVADITIDGSGTNLSASTSSMTAKLGTTSGGSEIGSVTVSLGANHANQGSNTVTAVTLTKGETLYLSATPGTSVLTTLARARIAVTKMADA